MNDAPRCWVLYARFSPRPLRTTCAACGKKVRVRAARHNHPCPHCGAILPDGHDCLSNETQLDRLRSWAAAMGATIVGEYCDEDKSGATTDGRPGLEAAMAHACKARATLCVYSLSRLSRDVVDRVSLNKRLRKAKAGLASLHNLIDTSTASGRFMFAVMAAADQFEREQTAERTSDGMRHHQDNGKRMGRADRAPYGKRATDDGRLEDDPEEQDIIAEIRLHAEAGLGPRAICRALDRQKIDRRGKTWAGAHGLVAKILRAGLLRT